MMLASGIDSLAINRFHRPSDQRHSSAMLYDLGSEADRRVYHSSVTSEDNELLEGLLSGIAFRYEIFKLRVTPPRKLKPSVSGGKRVF